jgi:glucoamylase
MPRDLPLGNGSLLVAFDENYQIRDLYWPHVGQENHALGHPFRLGIWVEGNFRWLDDRGWERDLRYEHERMVTAVGLKHPDLDISIHATDAVDFHENLLVRRSKVTNLSDRAQEVRLFFHHDFHIMGNETGDTAYYEFSLFVPPGQTRTLYYWMAAALDFESVALINRLVRQRGPQSFIDRTANFWRLWLTRHLPDLDPLPHEVCDLYERSLLVIRTQIDNGGAIIAANDSDIASSVSDTYSYMWPRDGALVAHALNQAGYLDLPRAFFHFCERALTKQGYLLHEYNPDGTLASSWHPWYRNGRKELPIQEDETALVLWALWEHFERFGDVFFIKPLYRNLICPMADFLVDFRDPETGLPLPSYGLWEEKRGVLSWTAAAAWGGLAASANFAEAFGEEKRGQHYRQAAEGIKQAVEKYLWLPDRNYFAKMLFETPDGSLQIDTTIDASISGLWQFGMYAPSDPKIVASTHAVRRSLWVKTNVGGIARYQDDRYHQVSQDIEKVPGNPWFITTLWLAEWYARTASTLDELYPALELLQWAADRSLPSGVLAEQVHPYTNAPLSVSPLTWSHAAFVSTVLAYLKARERLV